MDIGLLILPTDCSAAQPGVSMVSGTGQCQQLAQSGPFSALLNDSIQELDDAQIPLLSDGAEPIVPAQPAVSDDSATEAPVTGLTLLSCSQLCDLQTVAAPAADRAAPLPDSAGCNRLAIEPMPLTQQGGAEVIPSDDDALEAEPLSGDLPQARTAGSPKSSALQPLVDQAQSGEAPAVDAKQTASRIAGEPSLWKGLAVVPMEQSFGDSELSDKLPPEHLTAGQKPVSNLEQQGGKMGDLQSLDRPSPGTRPSSMIQEQGAPEATVSGQALSIRPAAGSSGGGGQDPFGASAQGDGEGAGFHSSGSGTPESGVRGTQSTLFSDLSSAARQTQSLPQGIGASVSTPAAEPLKLAQAFLGESHPPDVTAPRGMAQTVHVELPSHEAGPLSVRISVTDQMVHTQFTTDRSDLGAILVGRQDQLQQNLTRSGLELGQFQVHINQEGRQDALPDRQSRRNGEAPDRQLASQDQGPQSHDRERPNHRPTRALSLFA